MAGKRFPQLFQKGFELTPPPAAYRCAAACQKYVWVPVCEVCVVRILRTGTRSVVCDTVHRGSYDPYGKTYAAKSSRSKRIAPNILRVDSAS